MAVPALSPLINPVDELMLATEVFDETQVPPVMVDVKVFMLPLHIAWVPANVPAFGMLTVTDLLVLTLAHPPELVTVYIIVAVPLFIPVINPLVLTVAMLVFEDDQVPPATVDKKVVVLPLQMPCVPLNVPATGGLAMVMDLVALTTLLLQAADKVTL